MWAFHATGLTPARRYALSLQTSTGRSLCQPWDLSTFPSPDARPDKLRVLFYTCAGGHEGLAFLPFAVRNRMLRRALSFQPDAAVANGDHVYWDLRSPLTAQSLGGASSRARDIAGGSFDCSDVVLGSENEVILKRVAGPQIAPVYGTDFRSMPMFFIQDDHDYYENDDAYDEIVTFPPDGFMTEMARATQSLYYPEFLPDATRPRGLAGSTSAGRGLPISESFGTLRYGRLAEVLLYTVRRTMTMAGPSAVFLDGEVEGWLTRRMAASRGHARRERPVEPAGLDGRQVGRMVPRRARRRRQAHDGCREALLAGGLAEAARPPVGRDVAHARTDSAVDERRSARDRHRAHPAQRRARPVGQPGGERPDGPGRDAAPEAGLQAFARWAPRRRCTSASTNR